MESRPGNRPGTRAVTLGRRILDERSAKRQRSGPNPEAPTENSGRKLQPKPPAETSGRNLRPAAGSRDPPRRSQPGGGPLRAGPRSAPGGPAIRRPSPTPGAAGGGGGTRVSELTGGSPPPSENSGWAHPTHRLGPSGPANRSFEGGNSGQRTGASLRCGPSQDSARGPGREGNERGLRTFL